ncbi:MAG: hypothetical protein KIS88_00040 [Anaerolineales bacterium]|nr:hypothetical protein [Anaerolineales bacterium]
MRTHTLLPLAVLFLLSACGSAPAQPSESTSPPAQAAATSPAAAETDPTSEPTAAPSPTPTPPYSGPNPRLAMWGYEGEQFVLRVIELGSEEILATVPIENSWRMALSPDGRKLFNATGFGAEGVIYDLDSGESRAIDLSAQVREDGTLGQAVVWSPSQQWMSFTAHNGGDVSSWAYSLETGELKQFANSAVRGWSSTQDIVSYITGNQRATYNLVTGQETVWPSPVYEKLAVLLTHDGRQPDLNSATCWYLCVIPELGQVRDYGSSQRSLGRYHYDLVDTETMELLAHVATFQTERPLERETYMPDVAKLFPLWQRGDYLLFVQELAGPTIIDSQMHLYSAWSPSGEIPFTIVEGELANTLPNVLPMAVSPDGTTFVGFRFTHPEEYLYLVESAVVVDLATAEILYEYPMSSEVVYLLPPTEVLGAHIVWPSQ